MTRQTAQGYAGGPRHPGALLRWADGVDVAELSRLPAPYELGRPRSWPGMSPGAAPTAPPRPSTCSSRRSSASGTASVTSPITACGCHCTAASRGRLPRPQDCEAAHHVWWRRAGMPCPSWAAVGAEPSATKGQPRTTTVGRRPGQTRCSPIAAGPRTGLPALLGYGRRSGPSPRFPE
jgi:hypothetical protein